MNKIKLRAIQGGVLSVGAPLGWLFINFIGGANLYQEIAANKGLYSYMLFVTLFVFVLFGIFVGSKEQQISQFAIKDALTGIYNLRHYKQRMADEISRASRHQSPLALIYFDLDHFKRVNDNYGHPAGDEVLRQVAQTVQNIVRGHDIFARVGGEEFALLLPRCDLTNALVDAERIRSQIENLTIEMSSNQSIKITISLGVAALLENESAEDFYKRADHNLYQAKQQGRNRVFG